MACRNIVTFLCYALNIESGCHLAGGPRKPQQKKERKKERKPFLFPLILLHECLLRKSPCYFLIFRISLVNPSSSFHIRNQIPGTFPAQLLS